MDYLDYYVDYLDARVFGGPPSGTDTSCCECAVGHLFLFKEFRRELLLSRVHLSTELPLSTEPPLSRERLKGYGFLLLGFTCGISLLAPLVR